MKLEAQQQHTFLIHKSETIFDFVMYENGMSLKATQSHIRKGEIKNGRGRYTH